jgi:hypothetical protein
MRVQVDIQLEVYLGLRSDHLLSVELGPALGSATPWTVFCIFSGETTSISSLRKVSEDADTSEYREYCMTYGGPGFLVVIWYGSSPTTSLPAASWLSFSVSCVSRVSLLKGGGGTGWVWSQIIRFREGVALYKLCNTLSVSRSPKISYSNSNKSTVLMISLLNEVNLISVPYWPT